VAAIDLALLADSGPASSDASVAWNTLLSMLDQVGLDRVNYTFVTANDDAVLPSRSTMAEDWLKDYAARRLDRIDPLVGYTLAGGIAPLMFDAEAQRHESAAAASVCEAGMRAGLFVPLPRLFGTGPAAGLVMGSSLDQGESLRLMVEHGAKVVAAAHLFHAHAAGDVMREKLGATRLSGRQRDCLQAVARGERTSAIAYRLDLSEPTVALHLKNARARLNARSLPEAVARARLFGEIEPV